jgi:hypothetical protein
MCPHTTIYVCPHTTLYVSAYYYIFVLVQAALMLNVSVIVGTLMGLVLCELSQMSENVYQKFEQSSVDRLDERDSRSVGGL